MTPEGVEKCQTCIKQCNMLPKLYPDSTSLSLPVASTFKVMNRAQIKFLTISSPWLKLFRTLLEDCSWDTISLKCAKTVSQTQEA